MNLVTEADGDFTPPHLSAARAKKKASIKQRCLREFLCSASL